MSYHHPNSIYIQPTRPPSHGGYGSYSGPAMTGKPTAAGPPQVSAATPGYPSPVYLIQPSSSTYVNQSCYQPGAEGKYPGGGRGVTDAGAPQVLVGMTPQGLMYPAPHMQQSGTMLLQSGQQVIAVGPSPLYQASGGHQPRLRYAPSQTPGNQYGMGIAPQQQQQQQQQFYKNSFIPNQTPSQPPSSAAAAPKRERKILQIVDPLTGKEVDLLDEQKLSSVTSADVEVLTTTGTKKKKVPTATLR